MTAEAFDKRWHVASGNIDITRSRKPIPLPIEIMGPMNFPGTGQWGTTDHKQTRQQTSTHTHIASIPKEPGYRKLKKRTPPTAQSPPR
jgi:hypothetical protein